MIFFVSFSKDQTPHFLKEFNIFLHKVISIKGTLKADVLLYLCNLLFEKTWLNENPLKTED